MRVRMRNEDQRMQYLGGSKTYEMNPMKFAQGERNKSRFMVLIFLTNSGSKIRKRKPTFIK